MQSTQELNSSDLLSLTYSDASNYTTAGLVGKDAPSNNYVTVSNLSATPSISTDVDSLRYDNDGYLEPNDLVNAVNPLYNRAVNSAVGQAEKRLPEYDVAVARKAILSQQQQQPLPSARQSTASSSTSAMRGEVPAPNSWQQPTTTESKNRMLDHPYEELPPNLNNDYLTTRHTVVDRFQHHPVTSSPPSVSHRKADNPVYSDIEDTNVSAKSTTPACGGNVVKILVVLIIIMSMIAVAALVMAAYSVSMVWRTGSSNNDLPMNATVNVETLKEQIQQLQQENLLLPFKIAKLLGFDLPPDNSSLMLSDLLTNSSQIVAMLSDKVVQLIASTADGYRNLSSQANNLTAIMALITQQQQLQQSTWSNALAFVQTNLTARIDALSRLPGPQGPPGPATTVDLANCTLNSISSGGVIQLVNISTRPVNLQADYPDQIVTGVTCTTDTGSSALLNSDAYSTKNYYCTCSGSTSSSATSRYCYMYYWLCPRIFRGG